MNEAPVISGEFQLKKYPGKGGWTYLSLPKPISLGKKPFGQNKVYGRIDDYPFTDLSIWNTKAGDLFFPVKAEIRKMIGKVAGDVVRIEIFTEQTRSALPQFPLSALLAEEPEARSAFNRLPADRQQEIERWIDAARDDNQRVERLARTLDRLAGR